MATNISASDMLGTYALFNATDIKQFIINQLKSNPENPFKDVDYLGSNFNALIDVIAVMLQQILFSYSVNTAEASFSTASLYESMAKIVSLLNYKTVGKQTSMLPVRLHVNVPTHDSQGNLNSSNGNVYIPRFLIANYNKQYVLLNEETTSISSFNGQLDTVLYQGSVHESQIYIANGDDFELIHLPDQYINSGSQSFISDNFFIVYVNEEGDGKKWKEYSESSSLFLESSISEKYERRFTEDFGYEFKFGNGTYGKKLKPDARIIIYYLVSDGESGLLNSNGISAKSITTYKSSNYNNIQNSIIGDTKNYDLSWFSVITSGPSTAISYPESVASIRKNAPKVFASQGRLYSLSDYEVYIMKNFSNYCKNLYLCNNNEYVSEYLKYYYDIGLDAPQTDSRVALAHVEFMTAAHANNIYCFTVPNINTLIDGKVPNYLNTSLKKQIVNKCSSLMMPTHNLVIMDPLYRAFTFGSYSINSSRYNKYQINNRLCLVRAKNSKYDNTFIKNYAVNALKDYFMSLQLGSVVNCADIAKILNSIPGINSFYIHDSLGNKDTRLTLYAWNPLYEYEDNIITGQNIICKNFEYPYFYDIDNLENIINVVES